MTLTGTRKLGTAVLALLVAGFTPGCASNAVSTAPIPPASLGIGPTDHSITITNDLHSAPQRLLVVITTSCIQVDGGPSSYSANIDLNQSVTFSPLYSKVDGICQYETPKGFIQIANADRVIQGISFNIDIYEHFTVVLGFGQFATPFWISGRMQCGVSDLGDSRPSCTY